ncbi:MAG: iron chaperone [Bacteroidia bacterium]
MKQHPEVDAHIAAFSADIQARMQQIRALVASIAPEVEERLAYRMPAYRLHGKVLLYFDAYHHHLGLYALPNTHASFADELKAYKQGKGSVQFPHQKELPIELIDRMIRHRVAEIAK